MANNNSTTIRSATSFEVGNAKYYFEIEPPLYTHRPLQLLDEQSGSLEDRFHRTVKITRLADSRCWTGAADIKSQYMNDPHAYVRRWIEDCFAHWDLNPVPDGFEIPQGAVPREPLKHHCPEYPIIAHDHTLTSAEAVNSTSVVDTASEQSFPASDPPELTGVRVA